MSSSLKTLNDARWSCCATPRPAVLMRPAQRRVCTRAAVYKQGQAASAGGSLTVPHALSGATLPLPGWQQMTEKADRQHRSPEVVVAPLYAGKSAVVSGAGPCGTLSAIYLAQQGFSVNVFEKRPDFQASASSKDGSSPYVGGPRSFCIMLHRRGLEALNGAGVALPPSMCLKRGTVVRFRGTQMFATEASPWSHSVNRDLLTAYLITQAQELYPDKITFHFEHHLETLSLQENAATFAAADGSTSTVAYDFFIGADGAHSRSRAQFAAQLPGFTFTQTADDMDYKTTFVPPLGNKEPAPYFTLFDEGRNAFFVCARDVAAGGRTRGVFVLDKGGFDNLKSQEDYYNALKQSFPAPFSEEHYLEMSKHLVNAPLSHGNLNTHCSQLWGPQAVLVGDAAHSMWPTLGQGVNSALEDAAVLDRVLKEAKGDLSAVPKAFHNARHDDALAVVDLTWNSYGEGKHAISAVSIIKSMLLFWGSKLLPNLVPRPALSLMNETTMRYADIKALQEREQRTLDAAAMLVGATATSLVMGVPAAALNQAGGEFVQATAAALTAAVPSALLDPLGAAAALAVIQ